MNTELAMANIRSIMRDMGYKEEDYSVSFRHFVLPGRSHREIEAYNEIYYLGHEQEDVSIKSEFGLYDLSFEKTNELRYDHRGLITIENYSPVTNHLRFIHVFLKHKSN
jgi:hypothetical protein